MRIPGNRRVFLSSNLILLLVPLLMGAIFYIQTQNLLEKRVFESNLSLLDQGRTLIDTELEEFEGIIQQLSVHPQFPELLAIREPLEIPDLEWLIRFTREDTMFPYSMSNSLILEYYVFFEPGRIVVGPQQALPFDTFYRFLLSFEGFDSAEWYGAYIGSYHSKRFFPAAAVRVARNSYQVIPYVHSFGSANNHPVTVLILIDTRALFRLLKYVGVAPGGFVAITDADGRLMVSSLSEEMPPPTLGWSAPDKAREVRYAGRRMLVTRTVSPVAGWTIYSGVPFATVKADLKYIQITTALILAAFLLLGLAAAIYLAYKNSKPIKRLMELNRQMEQALDRQLPFLQSALVDKLLRGSVEGDGGVEPVLRGMDFPTEDCRYIAAVLKLPFAGASAAHGSGQADRRKADIKRLEVKEAVGETIPHPFLLHDFDVDRLAVVIALPGKDGSPGSPAAKVLFSNLKENLDRRFAEQLSIGVGSVRGDLSRISRSFEEARVALDYRVADGAEPVYFFDDLPGHRNTFYYPHDTEVRVIALAKSGNRREIASLLEEVEEVNFRRRKLSTDTLRALLFDMHATLSRILEQVYLAEKRRLVEESGELLRLLFTMDPLDGCRRIERLLEAVCRDVEAQKLSHNMRLKEAVQAYIEQRYLDHGICLKQMAADFKVSENYLSHFVKEQLGRNFFAYIEELRMKRAVARLAETDLQIKQIAATSGYSSLNSFCRAFKRIYGVSPGEYRSSFHPSETSPLS